MQSREAEITICTTISCHWKNHIEPTPVAFTSLDFFHFCCKTYQGLTCRASSIGSCQGIIKGTITPAPIRQRKDKTIATLGATPEQRRELLSRLHQTALPNMDLVLPVMPYIITEVMTQLCFLHPCKANKWIAQRLGIQFSPNCPEIHLWVPLLHVPTAPRSISGSTLLHVPVVLSHVPVSRIHFCIDRVSQGSSHLG